jgi:hypothetical protein
MTLENLYRSVDMQGICVDFCLFEHAESLSAPIGDDYVIAIDPTKVSSSADEKVKVAHEDGHCLTHSFYSPGEDYHTRQRFENRADREAIKMLVPKDELEAAVARGITAPWELADYFGVTQQFMELAMWFYQNGNLAMPRK